MTLATVPTGAPASLVAGDSAVWDDPGFSHPLYGSFTSSGGWALTYRFTGRVGQLEVAGVAQGDGWRTTLTADATSGLRDPDGTLDPETVRWTAQVTQGTDALTVASGILSLAPDPTTLSEGYQTEDEVLLPLVRQAIRDLVVRGVKSAQVQGRAYTKNELGELMKLEATLAARVWRAAHPGQFAAPIAGVFR